jgi:hypothetical protein
MLFVTSSRYNMKGTKAPEDQVFRHLGRFTVPRNMTRCGVRSQEGPGIYTCELDLSELRPTQPRGDCLMRSWVFPGVPPECGLLVPVEVRTISVNEYKNLYWK